MKIEELKASIEAGNSVNTPLILVYKDTGRLICEQYIDLICINHHLTKQYCSDVPPEKDFFDLLGETIQDNYLYITYRDEAVMYDTTAHHHIVCCHKVPNNIRKEFADLVVDVPELESWQLKSYAEGVLPGLTEDHLEWLCTNCQDPFRLMLEIERLQIFDKSVQDSMFDQLMAEGAFDDLVKGNIFNLSTAVQSRDLTAIRQELGRAKALDINPLALNNLLYSNLKDIATIKLSPSASPQTIGIVPKRFNALKRYVNCFSKEQLIKNLSLLSSVDYKLKTGQLSTSVLLDYLITHILS